MVLQCTRCKVSIETVTKLDPRCNVFLCNSCDLKWKERQEKMIGRVYQDELAKAFGKFLSELPYLR